MACQDGTEAQTGTRYLTKANGISVARSRLGLQGSVAGLMRTVRASPSIGRAVRVRPQAAVVEQVTDLQGA